MPETERYALPEDVDAALSRVLNLASGIEDWDTGKLNQRDVARLIRVAVYDDAALLAQGGK